MSASGAKQTCGLFYEYTPRWTWVLSKTRSLNLLYRMAISQHPFKKTLDTPDPVGRPQRPKNLVIDSGKHANRPKYRRFWIELHPCAGFPVGVTADDCRV